MRRALGRALLLLPLLGRPALAWDSRCEVDGAEGPEAAQHRWTDAMGRDEHRQIWLKTLMLAGAGADADFMLTSFTASAASYQPSEFLAAEAVKRRTHSPSEFAQLPDFSYSLWDWALGNETCPLGSSVGAQACHSFILHMGPVNSNHFPPQTSKHYNRYHALAMGRAADCASLRTKLAARPDLSRYVTACVNEALVLEAIAHHFLQDSWSMGHLWQRWGSPDAADFSSYATALAVAGFSGLVHGARAVLQPDPPTSFDVNDAMCAPGPDVAYAGPAGPTSAVGDMYLPLLAAGSATTYAGQHAAMYNCTVGSLRAVLAAAGEPLGTVTPGVSPIDPSMADAACFGARATNAAMAAAYAIDFKDGGVQHSVRLEALAAGTAVVFTSQLNLPIAPLQFDILRVGARIWLEALADPLGTGSAQGGVGNFLGVQPNAAYNKLGGYVDPDLPWPGTGSPDPEELALGRQFHEAHAKDWCDSFRAGDPTLDIDRLRDRVTTSTGTTRIAACAVCTEFAQRHLRFGDPATYVPMPSIEPLCGLIADFPSLVQFIYEPAAGNPNLDRRQQAGVYCGCDPLTVGAGTFRNEVTGAIGTALLVRLRGAGDSVVTAPVPFTVQGPPGWNGGQPFAADYPAGFLRQFFTSTAAPVSGRYTVQATVDGSALTAEVDMNAGLVLAAPGSVTPDLATPGVVGATWTAVPGAASYLARVFDVPRQRVLTPVEFTTSTVATLTGVAVNAANQNALQVYAFSNDMRPPDPIVTPQFNLSFNRTFLDGTVTVTPSSATVAPGASLPLTAAVSGSAGSTVTWSATGGGLAASGLGATWTAPTTPGTYTVTVTSVANPALRAYANLRVGGTCDATQVGQRFTGAWRVIGAVVVATSGSLNCDSIPEYIAFKNGGVIEINGGGPTGTLSFMQPAGLRMWEGRFFCPGGFNDSINAGFALWFGTSAEPDDVNGISGNVLLKALSTHNALLPCMMKIDAVRR